MSKNQDLGIAYNIKRKNKRKMAEGGTVKENESPPSAKSEARPMPKRMDDSGKAPKNDQWTDQPTVSQAQRPSKTPLSRPKMVGSDAFSVRDRDIVDAEDMRKMSLEAPGSLKAQPAKRMDEMGADRQGPSVPALKMKRMAEGGMARMDEADNIAAENDNVEHPANLESDNDQKRPPSEEYMAGYMAGRYAAGGEVKADDIERGDLDTAQKQADDDQDEAQAQYESDSPDMMKAEGGLIDLDEMEDEKHSSIAAAIMSKRDRLKAGSDSDDDTQMMMAEGGRIRSHGSMDSDDSDQADLSRNADEDANEEDQASFNALRKENYSESEGLEKLDSPDDSNELGDNREEESENKHDMVGSIRRKMSMRRQFR